jgi:hypothetical protein
LRSVPGDRFTTTRRSGHSSPALSTAGRIRSRASRTPARAGRSASATEAPGRHAPRRRPDDRGPYDGDAGHATRTYIRGRPVPSPIDFSILARIVIARWREFSPGSGSHERRRRVASLRTCSMPDLPDADRQRLALTFDSAADLYDRVRPDYPDALFDDLITATGLTRASRLLEVGSATG